MSDAAAVPSVFTQPGGPIYAMLGSSAIGPSVPVWKKIVRIDTDASGNVTSQVIQDYTLVPQSVQDAVQKAVLDAADSDDPPAQQQLLMTAWQALAMYLGSCDDEDKSDALNALKTVSNLMSDSEDGPTPTGTFGVTVQAAAADATKPASTDKDGKPLPAWMAKKQQKKSKQDKSETTWSCPQCSRDFASEQGMINHLQTVHAAREKQASATPANDKD